MIFSSLTDADFLDTEAFYSRAEGRLARNVEPKKRFRLFGILLGYEEGLRSLFCDAAGPHMRSGPLDPPSPRSDRLICCRAPSHTAIAHVDQQDGPLVLWIMASRP
jgi:hypothetical protein